MPSVEIAIVEVADEAFPLWLRCHLFEADGTEHAIIEKAPVLFGEAVPDLKQLPMAARLECSLLARNEKVVEIDISSPYGVASTSGKRHFVVVEGAFYAT